MKFSKAVVKFRIPILVAAVLLMIPAAVGMMKTRINYDMLNYLPDSMDTVRGQDTLMKDFGKGAFSFIIVENMSDEDVHELTQKLGEIEHVETVLWYDTLSKDLALPKEFLPSKYYDAFNTGDATMMAVFLDTSTSSDEAMETIREIRKVCGKQCYVSGMSALVTDLKDLCEKEEPVYVAIAVVLALAAMLLLLDNWIIPAVFIVSIGMMILMNLGSNIFLGEISYITKALSAVLQLAVTMDYSIFLWHSYNEQKEVCDNHLKAMEAAIDETFTSVIGSSVTTIAGFIALCFMTFTMGRDLGIVMAKGVLLGVFGCITVLPAIILVLEKPLAKTMHKSLIPNMAKPAKGILKVFPAFLAIFVILIPVFFYGYKKTSREVYYDMGECLPKEMDYVIANSKLRSEFNIASTHMILLDKDTPSDSVRDMMEEMEQVKGVKYVIGMESLLGRSVPEEVLPEHLRGVLESDEWKLYLINSEYKAASDEVNNQIDELNIILKKYDKGGMLIGEAPCMKDMIDTTDRDFKVVNAVSVLAIFVIIMLVEKSISLPFILISVIELAIFINLGLPHYMGQQLPFIAPICISTIQLGATVDYAILMTTRYKNERMNGNDSKEAVLTALRTSIPSVLVSGMGLFAATFGVSVYSDMDIIKSMCMLLARGAVVSMLCVIFILPALLRVFDPVIVATTLGMNRSVRSGRLHRREKEAH